MIDVTSRFAIDYLLDDCQDCIESKDGECMTQSHCFEVKQLAIKALKQYGVLQKIRQEIVDIPIPYDDKDTLEHQYGEGLIRDAVIEIIDKHRVESEK